MTPAEYLDAAKTRLNITSDYELARRIGIPRQYISQHRKGTRTIDNYTAFRLAIILERDPAELIADLESQTGNGPRQGFFRDFVQRAATLRRAAARIAVWISIGAALAVGAVGSNAPSRAVLRRIAA